MISHDILHEIVNDSFAVSLRNTHFSTEEKLLKVELEEITDILRTYPFSAMTGQDFLKKVESSGTPFTSILLSSMYSMVVFRVSEHEGVNGIKEYFERLEKIQLSIINTVEKSTNNLNFLKFFDEKALKEKSFSEVAHPVVNMFILLSIFLDINDIDIVPKKEDKK